MAFTICHVGATNGLAVADNTSAVFPLGGFIESYTEANCQSVFQTAAGTFDKGGCFVTANDVGATSTCVLRRNTTSGTLSISITASTTGLFSNLTASDVIAVGDKMNWQLTVPSVAGNHSVTIVSAFCRFSSNTNTFQKVLGAQADAGAIFNTNGQQFISIGSYLQVSGTTEAWVKYKYYTAGTLQKAQAYVRTNAHTSTCTINSRINGANGTIAVSITASTTGLFQDTARSDAVVSTDLVNMAITGSDASGNCVFDNIGMEFTTTTKKSHMYESYSIAEGTSGINETSYFAFTCNPIYNAAENRAQTKASFSATVTNLEFYAGGNGSATADTFDFRVGGASQALTISITALTTGLFEDAVNSVNIVSGNLCNYRLVTTASLGITPQFYGCMIQDTTSAVTYIPKMMLMGVG